MESSARLRAIAREVDDPPCAVCGLDPDLCDCPECPVCGEAGNPVCYTEHGLELSEEQVASKANAERAANFEFVEPDFGDMPDFEDDRAEE